MQADLSVVICSLNGAAGVDRCLNALAVQEDVALEVIVVDDGSTDTTSETARKHDVAVIRHENNRGLAAARNTGLRAASAPIVAFLDDDCEPEPEWARELLKAYGDSVIGVGGDVLPWAPESFMAGYLRRNNPLLPLEMDLARSENVLYRLYLYLRRQWLPNERHDTRDVYSLVGANMSFRRTVLCETRFDERFRFGGEDTDICLRLFRNYPQARLSINPDAKVKHHFVPTLQDTLRRGRSYARGSARLYRKWPSMRPTIFPGPVLVVSVLFASIFFPVLLVATAMLPHLIYPKGIRLAVSRRQLACALDAYVQLATETCGNAAYLQGLWQFRRIVPEVAEATLTLAPHGKTSAGSRA